MSVTMDILYDRNFSKNLLNLTSTTRAKVTKTIKLLEKFGYGLRMPYSKKIDSKLFELRVKGKEEIRIFYTIKNDRGVLLHLFKKKPQKTPPKEILTAKKKLESI